MRKNTDRHQNSQLLIKNAQLMQCNIRDSTFKRTGVQNSPVVKASDYFTFSPKNISECYIIIPCGQKTHKHDT